jgi:heme exporter protein CcmD
MIDLGQHAQFIAAAYIGVFLVLFALIAWVAVASRRTKARLIELGDKRG